MIDVAPMNGTAQMIENNLIQTNYKVYSTQ